MKSEKFGLLYFSSCALLEFIFDLIHVYDTSDKLAGFLAEEMPEKELQTIKSIAQSDYPLSFDLKQ